LKLFHFLEATPPPQTQIIKTSSRTHLFSPPNSGSQERKGGKLENTERNPGNNDGKQQQTQPTNHLTTTCTPRFEPRPHWRRLVLPPCTVPSMLLVTSHAVVGGCAPESTGLTIVSNQLWAAKSEHSTTFTAGLLT